MLLLPHFRRALLTLALPLTKMLGKLHAPWSHKKIKASQYHSLIQFLNPGDVILSRCSGELSNLFNPGHWTHGAMYIGSGYVVEAVSKGVVETDLIDFMLTKDEIIAFTPKFAMPDQALEASIKASDMIGHPYDFFFEPGMNAFYCFELIWWAYSKTVPFSPWVLRERLGVETIIGDDFIKASSKWQVIAEYD